MSILAQIRTLLAFLLRRRRVESDLDEELRAHLANRADDLERRGLTRAEAERQARIEFGGYQRYKEECREALSARLLGELFADLRYGLRQLRRNPGFTAVAIIALALGIGANTAIFSVVNAVLFMPLPFPHPDRLVQIWETNPRLGLERDTVSPYNFLDWQRQSQDFARMAVYQYHRFSLTGRRLPVGLGGLRVSADFFRVLGVRPFLGRNFRASDDEPGAPRVALLSYTAWQSHFGGASGIVGRNIILDGEPYTVIGVMPASFQFPGSGIEVWAAPGFHLKKRTRGSHYLFAIGRIKPGVPLATARSEENTIARRLAHQYPDTNGGAGILLVPLQEEIVGHTGSALLVLWGAVSLVLLIACANVANLLLSRGIIRRREFALRSALGAERARLIGQLLTESVLLAGAGGVCGLIVARFAISTLLHTTAIPRAHGISLDGRVLVFTALLALLTGIVFGLAPAVSASSVDLTSAFKQADSSGGTAWSHSRLRQGLILGEISLTLVLLVGAGLLIKSLWLLGRVDPGFDPKGVLTMRLSLPESKYQSGIDRAAEFKQIVERIAALPGVEGIAGVNDLPFSGSRTTAGFDIEGMPPRSSQDVRTAGYRTISPEYFKVMGIPLLKGREFSGTDGLDAPSVAIISETLARRYWPNSDPLGHHLTINDKVLEIVGVVGDVKLQNLAARGHSTIYVPYTQAGSPPWMFFAVRTHTKPESMIASVQKAAAQAAPDEPIYSVETMEDRLASSIAPRRLDALLLGIFAALALALAAVGTYGVIAYAVERRAHEIGIRMALGAQKGDVLMMVVSQGLKLALVGVGIGIAAAFGLTRFLASLLYGVKPTDPLTFIAVSLILIGVALLACYIPARRAAKVDPMVALRYE